MGVCSPSAGGYLFASVALLGDVRELCDGLNVRDVFDDGVYLVDRQLARGCLLHRPNAFPVSPFSVHWPP